MAQDLLKAAEAHYQAGRMAEAETVLRQLLQQQPQHTEALHALGLVAFRAGKIEAAVQLIEQALIIDANNALHQRNIAAMYRQTGKFDKAIEHGKAALRLKPDHPMTLNNLGVAYFDVRDFASSLASYNQAIVLDPRYSEALSNRANVLRHFGRLDEAEADCRLALEINPKNWEAHNNLGGVMRQQERPAEAEQEFRLALAVKANDRDAMHNLILALQEQKKYAEGLAAAEQALQAYPDSADALCIAGAIYLEMKNVPAAQRVINQSLAINPDRAESQNLLGRVYFESSQPEKAVETFERALAVDATYGDAYNNLGSALRELGRFDEAVAAYDKCLALTPANSGVYANLVDAKTFRDSDDRHLVAMERAVAGPSALSDERQMYLRFALGKAYDDLQRYDEAFDNLAQGCAIKRRSAIYNEAETLRLVERIKSVVTSGVVERLQGHGVASEQPIFIIGMPRSGTTLIEQIIASHPSVKGAGELREVNDALGEFRMGRASRTPYPELMGELPPPELAKFAQRYLERAARHAPASARFTDKMPSNFFYLGLIRLAMPKAKVIHVNRNPVDTCLSCHSKLFSGEVNYTYDLSELGRYYRAYHGLMQHWRTVLPTGSILDVQYEDVVSDIETQAKRILDYCGLSWDARVLDFHLNERPIKTASTAQVRQPIYSSSMGRWRNYEKHLGPLLGELGDLAR